MVIMLMMSAIFQARKTNRFCNTKLNGLFSEECSPSPNATLIRIAETRNAENSRIVWTKMAPIQLWRFSRVGWFVGKPDWQDSDTADMVATTEPEWAVRRLLFEE